MQDFKNIYFVREYIAGYSSIVAMFLSGYNPKYKIINKSELKNNMLIGMTFFSIKSYPVLLKIRRENPKNEIIVGGIGVYNSYNRILKHANYVYFGEGYEFDVSSVMSLTDVRTEIPIKRYFDYKRVPLVKISKNNYYCHIEVGCPYHCEYCYVGWVNKYSKINDNDFRNRIKSIDRNLKNKHIAFVGNEGLVKEKNKDIFKIYKNNKYDNQSITLKNYLKNYDLYKNQLIVRFGIELPTEDLREKHLPRIKQIKDEDLIECITSKYQNIIQLFYIWNYVGTTESDYNQIFNIIKNKKDFLLRLNFTTLEIQPYTPLVGRVVEHIEQLQSTKSFKESSIIDKLRMVTKTKIYPAKMNEEVLKWYIFTYTDRPLKAEISGTTKNEIGEVAKTMQIKDNVIKIVRF